MAMTTSNSMSVNPRRRIGCDSVRGNEVTNANGMPGPAGARNRVWRGESDCDRAWRGHNWASDAHAEVGWALAARHNQPVVALPDGVRANS